jgi:3-hydroxybutyryl-CoA dehydrogenase
MGAGIALAFARAGSEVTITARREASLRAALARVEASWARLAQLAPSAGEDGGDVLRRISMTTSLDDLDHVDLVVESIPERIGEKRDVLRRAEERALPTTLIVSNTSSLPLAELSAGLSRPQNFAGYHWFNPAELVRLVEVIAGPATADETIDRLVRWSVAIGKEPVRLARDIEGFVANRLQYALIREAYALVEAEVCSLEDVDRVVKTGLGPRWTGVGPFESMDLAGLDVHLEVARRLFPLLDATTDPPSSLVALVSSGALGAKSGRGLCGDYDDAEIEQLMDRRESALLLLAPVVGTGVTR